MSLPPTENDGPVRLTLMAHGAGCGCKISPAILEAILASDIAPFRDPRLLVGNESRDDAAVYDLGDGRAVISTTDFFTPIVDDAFDFGRVAATNALSDIYAMGGRPLLAVAILGWPVEKLPAALAARVMDGGRSVCTNAGIALAGGHSIDAPEPFFGLAVTGEVPVRNIKRNTSSRHGDVLLLTKPIGTGVHSTALKRGLFQEGTASSATEVMCDLNDIGLELGSIEGVHAMTDVTGFGLAGHLIELCKGSGLSAMLQFADIPVIPGTMELIAKGCYADGALRNWKSYGDLVAGASSLDRMMVLSDPQTSGGLLISVDPDALHVVMDLFRIRSRSLNIIGNTTNELRTHMINVS